MRAIIWITAVIFAAIYVAIAFATADRSPDQTQVNALIARGVEATRDRDLTTIVSCISSNYKDDSLNYDQLRMLLAQALRNETTYTVHTSDMTSKIDADHATVNMHVELRHKGGETFWDRKLTLKLVKEDDRHMFIAPVKAWRVIGSQNLGLGIPGGEF